MIIEGLVTPYVGGEAMTLSRPLRCLAVRPFEAALDGALHARAKFLVHPQQFFAAVKPALISGLGIGRARSPSVSMTCWHRKTRRRKPQA